MLEWNKAKEVCEAVLYDAGAEALKRFSSGQFEISTKGAQDFVSEVDVCAEQMIRSGLGRAFPNHTFLGEEGGGSLGGATWIIDPIDGTSNFVRGTAYWCLSAALVVEGQAVVAAIYDPNRDEMFSSQLGTGAWLNGKPMRVSTGRTLEDATLGISFNFQNSQDRVGEVVGKLIENGTSFRMFGAGALSLAHCASGRIDGFWEDFMKPWDAAAGLALIRDAGGVVCDYGKQSGYETGNPVLGTTPELAAYFSDLTGIALPQGAAK